jgi:MFS family permease
MGAKARPRRWAHALGLEPGVAALAASLFVFGAGQELWWRYLPAYLRGLGASALALGAFGTLTDFLDAAYAYPGGVLSDRLGSRRALLVFGVLTTLGFVVYLAWMSVPAVFLGLFLVMAWKSLGLPATFALIGEELAGGRRTVAFTIQAVLKRLPIVLAPPIGGILIESLGFARGMRAGFAASVVLSVVMMAGLRLGFRRGASMPALAPNPIPAGRTRLHPVLRRLLVSDCLIRLCEGLPDVFLVIWALEIVRISPAEFGWLISIQMATAIVSYVPAAALADRAEKKPFVVVTFLFFALFPLAVVSARSFAQLAAAYVVGGLREFGEPARKALIVDLSPSESRGRSVGAYYAIRGFAVAGAAAAGGALWTIRPTLTFFAAGLLGAAGTLWAMVSLPARPAERQPSPS